MKAQRLYLIDATAFCYRAFYALTGLATSFGQPTGAVYGFVNMLNKILKEKNPQYLAVCFDVSRETLRQKKFAEYKIQRPPMPEGLTSQIPVIKRIVAAYGIRIFEKEGYEADDLIATIVSKTKQQKLPVTIISSDKDILQLVDSNTEVSSPHKDASITYGEKEVLQRFGVKPEAIADIIALMGDSADNIPGARGIGEKTARQLIKEFGSLDNILANSDKIKPPKIKQAIKDSLAQIKLSKELALLDKEVEIDFSFDKVKIGQPDHKELFSLFKHLEFKKFLQQLPIQAGPQGQTEQAIARLADKELEGILNRGEELILYGQNLENMVFYAADRYFQIKNIGPNLKNILSDNQIKKTGHDLKKIKTVLARQGITLEGLYFDTMIAAYLLNPAKSEYNLIDIAWQYLEEAQSLRALGNLQAAEVIRKLKPKLSQDLSGKSLLNLFQDIEMPLVEVLFAMETEGIKLDAGVLREISRDLEARLIKLIREIYALSGCEFNINSPKQLRDILFDKLKLPAGRKSKTGPSTDEEVLKKLADLHPLPKLLLEYRQLMKLKNTYIDTLPKLINLKTGRIHSSFNQTATETGRLSSSEPNLQNIPVKTDIGKHIRRAIISFSADCYLLSCDYSQVELRILAHLSGDDSLVAAFKQDKDIHRATASLIYGLAQEDVTEPMRDVAKRVNFGIIYGLSAYGLSRDLGISAQEATSFIDAYFLRYPKVKDYIQGQIKLAEANGFVATILGRRRYLPEINNKNQAIRQFAQRQAINAPIQGSASDLIKLAMINIQQQIKLKKMRSCMILQVHDELLFNLPEEEQDELVGLVQDKMENVLKLNVPLRVSIKRGRNWLEMEDIG